VSVLRADSRFPEGLSLRAIKSFEPRSGFQGITSQVEAGYVLTEGLRFASECANGRREVKETIYSS